MSETTRTSDIGGGIVPWTALGRWSATAFLVAGAFYAAFAVRNGVIAFGGGFGETTKAALYLAFVVPGVLAADAGLLGIAGDLRASVPRSARAGAALTGIAAVAVTAFGLSAGSGLLGQGPPEPPAITGLFFLVTIASTVLAFLLVAAGSLRASEPAGTVGLLLLVPPTTYVVMMAGTVVGYTPEWSTVALSAVQALAHLAIGVGLRGAATPVERASPTAEST